MQNNCMCVCVYEVLNFCRSYHLIKRRISHVTNYMSSYSDKSIVVEKPIPKSALFEGISLSAAHKIVGRKLF